MIQESSRNLVATVLVLSASACATMTPPVRTGAPTQTSEGVELAVARKHCDQTQDSDWDGEDLAELIVEVQVKNPTRAPIAIHRGDMRLLAPDGAALKTITWRADDPLYVASGETKSFDMRFMARGSLECGAPLQLDTRGAVTTDHHVLVTDRISFTPSAPL